MEEKSAEERNKERAELEQQLRQAQKMEVIGQLAGGIAHDFNNALMAINGFCDILLIKIPENNSARQEVLGIQKAAQQAGAIARQLLAFSRKQVLEPRVLDINQILGNMENMLTRLLGADVHLETHLDPGLGLVRTDSGQMEQVIMNLVVNARDAMPDGGKLTIETANLELDQAYIDHHLNVQPGRYVLLAVTDTGSGMDEATRLRIFEPFFTTKSRGTGLGLSTCFGIIKQSGGDIWVYSEPGRGTSFKIYLPRIDEKIVPAPAIETNSARQKVSETIMLVDDSESVRDATGRMLRLAGYKVFEASNGKEALQIANTYNDKIDLLITDVVMPQMSGPELAAHLLEKRPEIRVLYMSGYTAEAVQRQGKLDPASFLPKPASMQILLTKIREVLQKVE